MEENIYQPPKADMLDVVDWNDTPRPSHQSDPSNQFYVVGLRKFLLLFFFTLGIYQIYWFYKNWFYYRQYTNRPIRPVGRTIFSIFFTHALFKSIDNSLMQQGIRRPWRPMFLATIYVMLNIAIAIIDQDPGSKDVDFWTTLAPFACLPVLASILYRVQQAINLACGRPNGEGNQELTAANYAWIAVGILWGSLSAVGLYDLAHHAAHLS